MKQATTTEIVRHKRELDGVVVSKSGQKTVAVEIVRVIAHSLYGKRIKQTKRYLAHDESNSLSVGDTVTIQESRPLSARKRWVVVPKKGTAL
ncbi:MAG: 30S ribosomal protein S17 [bacterium]|nr:30S ribosomal protein S17 [bacterium]